MKKQIAGLPGDGIGPEVFASARQVLETLNDLFSLQIELSEHLIGGAAYDACCEPLPQETIDACRQADGILLGAVGGPQWADVPVDKRPEQGLLDLRREFQLYCNLRPVAVSPALKPYSPLKSERLGQVDMVIVRELTGGIYFGEKTRDDHSASDQCRYTVEEIERITRMACRLARDRRGKLTSVDKANVLETSRLWREVVSRVVAEEFPSLRLEHMLVDAAAMHLISKPRAFDVILTENMFGDILSDEASMLSGSLGMLPSASLSQSSGRGNGNFGLYEPIHGSAPDIAGMNIANPYGMLLSVAMMLRYSLAEPDAANTLEHCIYQALEEGVLTADLCAGGYSTTDVTADICERLSSVDLFRRAAVCYE